VNPLKKLQSDLAAIRDAMIALENRSARLLRRVHPRHRESARNLLHYLALRQRDLRNVQQVLSRYGLSSLGRAECGALGNVETVMATVDSLLGMTSTGVNERRRNRKRGVTPEEGHVILARHTQSLLGTAHRVRRVRIMVTMPSEAALDLPLLRGLLRKGMNVLRINCARDDSRTWSQMIVNLRKAERATGKRCKVFMDLAGPKPRTGPVAPGPAVLRWRPTRDCCGRVVSNALVLLAPAGPRPGSVSDGATALPVASDWLGRRKPGETVRFLDARKSPRKLTIVECGSQGAWAESDQTSYVIPGTVLYVQLEEDGYEESWLRDETPVCAFPATSQRIPLKKGDVLVLTRDAVPGEPAIVGTDGKTKRPAHIGVSLPGALKNVRVGDRVWFDDGKLGGVIRRCGTEGVIVEITQARARGRNLSEGRSINLPDTAVDTPMMTRKDAEDIRFAARHADMVGLSFVRTPADIRSIQSKLNAQGASRVGVIVKVENRSAFEQLPRLLFTAMRSPNVGVLIARGDLAVECGFERLAEVQEEILWLCEAAHLPVFWATQVLEKMAQEGMPSRAEITDAAAAERAECVMLNKGPYIFSALTSLDNILRRMQSHVTKKRPLLRPLRVAEEIGRGN
jgi:pyruvate kinase